MNTPPPRNTSNSLWILEKLCVHSICIWIKHRHKSKFPLFHVMGKDLYIHMLSMTNQLQLILYVLSFFLSTLKVRKINGSLAQSLRMPIQMNWKVRDVISPVIWCQDTLRRGWRERDLVGELYIYFESCKAFCFPHISWNQMPFHLKDHIND